MPEIAIIIDSILQFYFTCSPIGYLGFDESQEYINWKFIDTLSVPWIPQY
jgi:hypothetical protein